MPKLEHVERSSKLTLNGKVSSITDANVNHASVHDVRRVCALGTLRNNEVEIGSAPATPPLIAFGAFMETHLQKVMFDMRGICNRALYPGNM